MPNQPAPNTVATCFTLPRDLLSLVENKAKREMTNKSDIIRRALMNYLSPSEQAWVRQSAAGQFQSQSLNETPEPSTIRTPAPKRVRYSETKSASKPKKLKP